MIVYPLDYNPILEYWQEIETGKVVVGKKIRAIYSQLVEDLNRTDWDFKYDPQRANHAIEFIENYCKHSTGRWGGKPVVLELWQKAFLSAIFGFVDLDGNRKYREVKLVVGRKNGKSTLSAAISLYMMIADGEPGAQIFAVATKRDQAKAVWEEAVRMVKKSPALLKRIKTRVGDMVSAMNDSSFKPVGRDSKTLDGLNVHYASMDETHAWTNRDLFNVFADAVSARLQPLIIMITTAGTVRENLYDAKYQQAEEFLANLVTKEFPRDERFLPFIYELDHRDEWIDETCWQKANPGLGTIKGFDFIRNKVENAKGKIEDIKNILTKDFNIPETPVDTWLTLEQVMNDKKFDPKELKPTYGIGGADLSATTDLTAAKIIFMVPNDQNVYVMQMYWLPEDLLEQRAKEDRSQYMAWHERGLLRTTPGNFIDQSYITAWFEEVSEELNMHIPWTGFDRWESTYWVNEMKSIFGKNSMIDIAQGTKTFSAPMKLLAADLEAKRIVHNNNPIDLWCLTNTLVETDKNGNIRPIKGKNKRKRVDGTFALLNAYVILQDKKQDYLNLID